MNQIQLRGKDALDLLHRISTINVQSLSLNQLTPCLILNPQGKIETVFDLIKESNEHVSLFCHSTEKCLKILDQYTFGERYEIKTCPAENKNTQSEHDRILAMQPRYGFEFLDNGETNPLEINFTSAIHDQKGCYPGQEIIEKIIALGSPPRRLCLIKTEVRNASLKLPVKLLDSQKQSEVATLTSFDSESGYGLAIVRRTHCKTEMVLATNHVEFVIKKCAMP